MDLITYPCPKLRKVIASHRKQLYLITYPYPKQGSTMLVEEVPEVPLIQTDISRCPVQYMDRTRSHWPGSKANWPRIRHTVHTFLWLTHCCLGDFKEILDEYFQANYNDLWLRYLQWNKLPSEECHYLTDDQVNIGSGNGLVSSGNKPLPEPMLT